MTRRWNIAGTTVVGLGLVVLAACEQSSPGTSKTTEASLESSPHSARDLSALKRSGQLRILMPEPGEETHLPRAEFPLYSHEKRVAEFCKQHGLKPVIRYVAEHDQLLAGLLAGKGDLVVANLTITPERRQQVAFSVPVDIVRELVVLGPKSAPVRQVADLAGRKVYVRKSSSYFQTLSRLKRKHADLHIVPVSEHLDTQQILQRVASGEYDLGVADSNIVEVARRYLPDLKTGPALTGERPLAWAARKQAPELLTNLNQFLSATAGVLKHDQVYTADLPELRNHKVLRVLTRNNATSYYLVRGKLVGFEYDLVRHFAKQHDLQVEIVVPPAAEDLIPWLLAGRGDVVAASLTLTAQRKKSGAAFSRPYHWVHEMVVAGKSTPKMKRIEELSGHTVWVRRSSSYWQSLQSIRAAGVDLKIEAAPEEMETEELISKVADGSYELTVADSHILDIELTYRDDVKAILDLDVPGMSKAGPDQLEKTGRPHVWALHPQNKQLLTAIDRFFKKEYRGEFYNITRRKYFKSKRRIRRHVAYRAENRAQLSPYDALVNKFAGRYGFDPALITAQMYTESRFDPKARSWVGARGLMQVMPRTADELGFTKLEHPANGVHAGVKYLDWLRKRFGKQVPEKSRIWFALAAYNAGIGHVLDARQLAREQQLDPDRWFGHVEKSMRMLSRPEVARRARFGYCRGSEPVAYVRAIRERSRAYRRKLDRANQ